VKNRGKYPNALARHMRKSEYRTKNKINVFGELINNDYSRYVTYEEEMANKFNLNFSSRAIMI